LAAEDVLIVEKLGPICRLTLNRPQRLNAINRELGGRLIRALDECAEDDDVRVIVLAGAGRAFCAGDDIRGSAVTSTEAPAGRRDLIESVRNGQYFNMAQAFRGNPKPIIARVHGYAFGAGMDLVLASDIAIASDDARIAAVFVRNGIIGGTAQLPRAIGIKRAMEMLLSGDEVSAARAVELGLVNYAVPAEQLDDAVQAWAQKLAAGPTRIMSMIKLATYRGLDMSFQDSVMLAAVATGEARQTQDAKEGRAAFAEKRAPNYTGR
jgi:2-(1,2-epoxy-1,2-dihydrophenyl)acetyl-CoA isomerase